MGGLSRPGWASGKTGHGPLRMFARNGYHWSDGRPGRVGERALSVPAEKVADQAAQPAPALSSAGPLGVVRRVTYLERAVKKDHRGPEGIFG
jgi:hypothetical protein